MKKMRAILSVLLCLLMMWACFAPATAGAANVNTIAKSARQLNGDDPQTVEPNWDAFYAAIEEVFFTAATTVDVTSCAIPYTEEGWNDICKTLNDMPQMLHITGLSIQTTSIEGQPSIISSVNYSGDWAKNAEKRDACEKVMFKLLRGIEGNTEMSVYDKLLLVHDRLIAWAAYDTSISLTANADSYNAYGALVNGKAVCQGYSMAYSWMLKKLGIDSTYETGTLSDGVSHGWLRVTLDGKDYYVDATWDDPVNDVPGRVLHENFLIDAATFEQTHGEMEGLDETVADTAFADSFDKNTKSEIVRIRGNYYYMKYNVTTTVVEGETHTTAENATLMRHNPTTGSETKLWTVETLTYSNQTNPNAENKGDSWLYVPKMTAIGTKVIYADGRALYAFDVTTPEEPPVEIYRFSVFDKILDGLDFDTKSEFRIQGLTQKDGTLYITVFNDASFDEDTVAKYTITLDYCQHENKTLLEKFDATKCSEKSTETFICEDCRKVWTEEGEAGQHIYGEAVVTAPTCVDYEKFTYTCTICGDVKVEDGAAPNPNNHVADKLKNIAAVPGTCQEDGYTAGVFCEACGNYVSGHEATGKDLNNHVGTKVTKRGKTATCETAGWSEELTCTGCGAIVQESAPIAKRGHEFNTTYPDVVVEPTCMEDGYTLHKCARCWKEFKDTIVPAAGEHPADQLETVEAVVPTCISEGYTAGVYCNACKTYVEGHKLLFKDPSNHVHGFQEVNKDPTCTENGVRGASMCPDCHAYEFDKEKLVEIRGEVLPALGHSFSDDGEVIKEPTCTDEGLRKQVCATCHESVVSPIDALGHLDLDGNEICDRCSKNLNKNACPYCNQIHSGPFAFLVNFFHKIMYLIFGAKKAK